MTANTGRRESVGKEMTKYLGVEESEIDTIVKIVDSQMESWEKNPERDRLEDWLNFRIQFLEGAWDVKTGDPQYDTDHRGAWGYASVNFDPDDIEEAVLRAIEDAIEDEISQRIKENYI